MPELPEIVWRARELDQALRGKVFAAPSLLQPKCCNLAPDEFVARLAGLEVLGADYRGKWVDVHLSGSELLLNLGMGGEILLHAPGQDLPPKLQAILPFADGARLSLHFWWFGYIHLLPQAELAQHKLTARLGADPLSSAFTPQALQNLVQHSRTRTKTLLLDQSVIAGIGNMYAHDILFRAHLHPQRPAQSLTVAEIQALWEAIRATLQLALDLGGSEWEKDLYGQGGHFAMQHLLVGYKEGQPCPACGASIRKIKTGATAGFICPICQPG